MNQNEVRALLEQARSAGPRGIQLVAEPVDIVSDDRHLRSVVPTLQLGYARLAENLRRVLTSVLRTRVDIREEEPELLSGRGLVSIAANAATLIVLRVEMQGYDNAYAVLAVDRTFAFAIIERIFGGLSIDETAPTDRSLTSLEARMLARALAPFIDTLNRSLEPAGFFKFSIHALEHRLDLVPGFTPDMTVLHVPFTMTISDRLASFSIAKPATALEPLRARLGLQNQDGRPSMMPAAIKNVNVTLSVELGRATLSLRQVLNLQPGTVITLDRGRNELLPVQLEGVNKFQGIPVQDDGNIAVEIAGRQP